MPDPSVPASSGEAKPGTIDDLMLAMDVVDTLRHREDLVRQELQGTRRDAELIEKLRQIYASQGIDVPDRVLAEGVAALRESRFVYVPPRPGLGTALARLWVARRQVGRALLGAAAAILLAWAAYHFALIEPSRRAARELEAAHGAALAESRSEAGRQRAGQLLEMGRAALERGEPAAASQSVAALEDLRAELQREYTLRIVSEVWKTPPNAVHRREYYLVVEATAPDGSRLRVPVDGEGGSVQLVERWGVRVPEETYVAVERDRRDDGILQRDRLGVKRPGELQVAYEMPVLPGTITQW